jgi:cathepsin L
MRLLVCIALLVAFVASHQFKEEEYQLLFSKWMKQHNKKYSHDNFFYRYTVFKQNLDKIHLHNQKQNASFSLSMNEFGDQTHAEFKAVHLGYARRNRDFDRKLNLAAHSHHNAVAAPSSIDWHTTANPKGRVAVTPVKNQQQCGSCWSFSTTGSVEGAVALKTGKLVSLSEQMLVDCSQSYGNQGCEGGLMDQAFQYIIATGGLCTESQYPYTAADGTCQYPSSSTCTASDLSGHITSYKDVANDGTDTPLMAAIQLGPVSIAIEADQESFQFYQSGVYSDPGCGTQLDHGVLLVGYGSLASKPYWIVKNSWGNTWGQNGYILLARGQNQCGMDQEPSFPLA